MPGAAVTSDFIVGFCGETEDDFEQTVDLVRESRFKNSFIFKYSPRPGTKGAELFADDVPRRNQAAAEQRTAGHSERRSAKKTTRPFIGREVEVLVEGPSKAETGPAEASDVRATDASPLARCN